VKTERKKRKQALAEQRKLEEEGEEELHSPKGKVESTERQEESQGSSIVEKLPLEELRSTAQVESDQPLESPNQRSNPEPTSPKSPRPEPKSDKITELLEPAKSSTVALNLSGIDSIPVDDDEVTTDRDELAKQKRREAAIMAEAALATIGVVDEDEQPALLFAAPKYGHLLVPLKWMGL